TATKPGWQTAQFNGTNIANVGSPTWTLTNAGSVYTATKSDISGAPSILYLSPVTAANATTVTYVFDRSTDSGNGSNRKVNVFTTNSFTFTLLDSAGNPSNITTTCNFQNLTVN